MWKKLISESELTEGIEYLFHDPSWVDLINNPKGVRLGYYYDFGFIFCFWNDDTDSYDSVEMDLVPKAYFEIPNYETNTGIIIS